MGKPWRDDLSDEAQDVHKPDDSPEAWDKGNNRDIYGADPAPTLDVSDGNDQAKPKGS